MFPPPATLTSVKSGRGFAALMVKLQSDDAWANRLGELAHLLSFIGATFEEIESYRDAVLLSLETTFSAPMEEFVRREVKTVKSMKLDITECAEQYEVLLSKFLQLKTNTDRDTVEQKQAELALLKKKYELSRYDLVTELNSLETKKKFQLCERACSALYSYLGFFHQCHTLGNPPPPRPPPVLPQY